MGDGRHFRLEAGEHKGAIGFLLDRVEARSLGESATTMETVTRAGLFYDPRYGWQGQGPGQPPIL